MIADLVAKLIAAGTPADVAATVIAEAFAAGVSASIPRNSADVSADKRREKDRIRKQIARGIPQKSADVHGNPQMSENASLYKEEKIESKIPEREATQRKFRGARLPDDWAPTAIDHAISLEMLGPDRSKSELEKYRDHWKQQPGSKGVKLDWDAAWRNWIRRSAEFRGGTNGHRAHNASNGSSGGSFFDGLRSLAADIAGDAPAPGAGSAEIPRGRFEIDG